MEQSDLWSLLQPRLRQYCDRHTRGRELLARFVGVSTHTVGRWYRDKTPAQGERVIRLWHFLATAGFESPELEALPAYCKQVSRLFAFSVVPISEVVDICGITQHHGVFRIMRGQQPLRPKLTLEELEEMYGSQLSTAERKLRRELRELKTPTGEERKQHSEPDPLPVPLGTQPASGVDNAMMLATLLSAATPLVRHFVSDQCNAVQRSRFRAIIGDEELFQLSNNLHALCSERARSTRR